MSNIRKTIRDRMKTAITGNGPAAALVGSRVIIGRDNITDSTEWPCVFIIPLRDETDTHTMSVSRQQRRRMTVALEYWLKVASDSTPVEDDIDNGADILTTAVLADTTLAGACADIVLTSLDYVVEGREELRYGTGRITFVVTYFTRES